MFFGDQTIGAFSVRSTRRKSFPPEEVEMAQTLAHQATLAIQLTRLAEKERESAERQRRDLEASVSGRTVELNRAVEALNAEVVERQLTERVSRGQTEALTPHAGPAGRRARPGHVPRPRPQHDHPPTGCAGFDVLVLRPGPARIRSAHEQRPRPDLDGQDRRRRGDELPTRFDDSHPDFRAPGDRRPVVQNDVPNNPHVARASRVARGPRHQVHHAGAGHARRNRAGPDHRRQHAQRSLAAGRDRTGPGAGPAGEPGGPAHPPGRAQPAVGRPGRAKPDGPRNPRHAGPEFHGHRHSPGSRQAQSCPIVTACRCAASMSPGRWSLRRTRLSTEARTGRSGRLSVGKCSMPASVPAGRERPAGGAVPPDGSDDRRHRRARRRRPGGRDRPLPDAGAAGSCCASARRP